MNLLYKPGVAYYKVEIGLLNLSSEAHQQGVLFPLSQGNSQLMIALDSINNRYGIDTTFFAAQGAHYQCSMHRDLLTPKYTTN